MSHENLLKDLFRAYYCARKNKRSTINALKFEMEYEKNIFQLCRDIESRKYEIGKSVAFIVNKPVKREIFAADFRDRIVHHLIFNAINPIFEKHFIKDSYSCRIGKGTSYGIKRVDHFIRSCSKNYQKDCWILKLDISGYFMSMDRKMLLRKIEERLNKYKGQFECRKCHSGLDPESMNLTRLSRCEILKPQKNSKAVYGAGKFPPKADRQDDKYWGFDVDLIGYLIREVVFHDPTKNCTIKGKREDWQGLPKSKSLFFAKPGKGFPIGNLTSQLFGNIYLDRFDHFVKEKLKIKYYGRYVDDMIFVHPDKELLKSVISQVDEYLQKELGLMLHPKKIYLQHFSKGVAFLGTFIKPWRIYIGKRIKGNFYATIRFWNEFVKNKGADSGGALYAKIFSLNEFLSWNHAASCHL